MLVTEVLFNKFNDTESLHDLIQLIWHLHASKRDPDACSIVRQWLHDHQDCPDYDDLCILGQFFVCTGMPTEALAIFDRFDRPGLLRHQIWLMERAYAHYMTNAKDFGAKAYQDSLAHDLVHAYFELMGAPHLKAIPAEKFLRRGDEIQGKSIWLINDAGIGDAIQNVRFFEPLAALGSKAVYYSPPAPLCKLLESSGIQYTNTTDAWPAEYDYVCTLQWLFAEFGVNRQQTQRFPYLKAGPVSLGANPLLDIVRQTPSKTKVALFWKSTTKNRQDPYRAIKIQELAPLLQIQDVAFYSLIKAELTHEEAYWCRSYNIQHLGDRVDDFNDLACLFNEMDLIISVDSAPVHLAGAMGKPVYALISKISEWRWGDQGELSDLYPSLRLFRQNVLGDWTSPVERMAFCLSNSNDL